MDFEILETGIVNSDGPGYTKGMTYFRVAMWYRDEDHDAGKDADTIADFTLHLPPEVRQAPIIDDVLGYRQAVSGTWYPLHQEVDGEWVSWPIGGPDGDPWATKPEAVDVEAWLMSHVEEIGQRFRAERRKAPDVFDHEEMPKVRKAKRGNGPEERAEKMKGLKTRRAPRIQHPRLER